MFSFVTLVDSLVTLAASSDTYCYGRVLGRSPQRYIYSVIARGSYTDMESGTILQAYFHVRIDREDQDNKVVIETDLNQSDLLHRIVQQYEQQGDGHFFVTIFRYKNLIFEGLRY